MLYEHLAPHALGHLQLFQNKMTNARQVPLLACENIRFSSLFAAGDVSWGGTSATQRQKFHTDDANQCLHNKSGSHGVPNINLSNFACLLVDFGKVLCWSAHELQQNSNASSREDYIPQILTVLLEILRIYIWPLWPFVFCLSFVNNNYNNVTTLSTNQHFWPDSGQILRHRYGISPLSLTRRCSSAQNVPSSEERGETDVFAGYAPIRLAGQKQDWWTGPYTSFDKRTPLLVTI